MIPYFDIVVGKMEFSLRVGVLSASWTCRLLIEI